MASMDIDPPESTVPSATASTSALTSQAESDAGPSSQLCLRDKLLFAQAVHKVGAGKEKWPAVRNLMEGNEMVEMKKGILEEETCEAIYVDLMSKAGFNDLNVLNNSDRPNAPQHLRLAQFFYVARMEELRGEIEGEEEKFRTLVSEIEAIKSGETSYMLSSLSTFAYKLNLSFSIKINVDLLTQSDSTGDVISAGEKVSVLDEVKSALIRNRKRKRESDGGGGRIGRETEILPTGWVMSKEQLRRMATGSEPPASLPLPSIKPVNATTENSQEPIVVPPLQIQPTPQIPLLPIPSVTTPITTLPRNRNRPSTQQTPVIIVPDDPEDGKPSVPGERFGRDIQMAQTLVPKGGAVVGSKSTPGRRAGKARSGSSPLSDIEGGGSSDLIAEDKKASSGMSPQRSSQAQLAAAEDQPMDVDEEISLQETDQQARDAILQDALAPQTAVGEDVGLIAVDENGEAVMRDDLETNKKGKGKESIRPENLDAMDVEEEPSIDDVVRFEGPELPPDDDDDEDVAVATPAPAAVDPSPPPMSPALPPAKTRRASTAPSDRAKSEQADQEPTGRGHRKAESVAEAKSRRGTRGSVASLPAPPIAAASETSSAPGTRRSSRQKAEDAPSPGPETPGRPDRNNKSDREEDEEEVIITRTGGRRRGSVKQKERSPSPEESTPARATRGSNRAVSGGLEKISEDKEPSSRTKSQRGVEDDADEEIDTQDGPEETEDGTGASSRRGPESVAEDGSEQAEMSRPQKPVNEKEMKRLAKAIKDKERYYANKARLQGEGGAAAKVAVVNEREGRRRRTKDDPAPAASSDAETSTRHSPQKPSISPQKPSAATSSIGDSPIKTGNTSANPDIRTPAPRATRAAVAQVNPTEKKIRAMLNGLHEEIEGHVHARPFSSAIRSIDAPGYYEIVKKPTNLKQIKSRIKSGAISSIDEYQRDLWMLFCNAMMYNKPGSEIYNMAEEMMLSSEKIISHARNLEHHTKIKQST